MKKINPQDGKELPGRSRDFLCREYISKSGRTSPSEPKKAEYMALSNKTAAERIKEKAGIPEIRYLCF